MGLTMLQIPTGMVESPASNPSLHVTPRRAAAFRHLRGPRDDFFQITPWDSPPRSVTPKVIRVPNGDPLVIFHVAIEHGH